MKISFVTKISLPLPVIATKTIHCQYVPCFDICIFYRRIWFQIGKLALAEGPQISNNLMTRNLFHFLLAMVYGWTPFVAPNGR